MAPGNEHRVGMDDQIPPAISRRVTSLLGDMGHGTEVSQDPFQWLTHNAPNPILVPVPRRTATEIQAATISTRPAVVVGLCNGTQNAAVFREYLKAGATSIIGTDIPFSDLPQVLAAALKGFTVLPQSVAAALANRLQEPPPLPQLTARDTQLLNLIAQGASRKAMAAATGYSQRHLRRITTDLLSRIGAINHAHAAALATQWGLVATTAPVARRDQDPAAQSASNPKASLKSRNRYTHAPDRARHHAADSEQSPAVGVNPP